MKRKVSTTLATLGLMAVVAGCGGTPAPAKPEAKPAEQKPAEAKPAESTLARAKAAGFVAVGFANENPYAYATPDGKLTGEAVEVARAVLTSLGIKEMSGVLTEFGSLIPGVKAKRFDMVTAGMFINPKRCQEVAFANPEYKIGEALAVKKGNPLNLHSYEDIKNNPKARVGVMGGAVEQEYLEKTGVPKDRIVVVPDQPAALAALQAGRVDAITMTGPALQALINTAKATDVERVMDFKQPVIDGKSTVGYGATAFRKEDKEFVEAFNQELEKLKKSGKLLEILKPFGFTEAELPGDMTAEQLCKG